MLFETLVDVFAARGMQVPQEKEQEFRKRLEKLFQAGGMMTVNKVSMFGIETYTLREVRMYKNGMNFCYSYFEEDFWEDAGYSVKDRRVRSKNIGFRLFNRTMIAAYVLENLYTEWEKRQNIARVTLRRYMALVANVELRKDVFGF